MECIIASSIFFYFKDISGKFFTTVCDSVPKALTHSAIIIYFYFFLKKVTTKYFNAEKYCCNAGTLPALNLDKRVNTMPRKNTYE